MLIVDLDRGSIETEAVPPAWRAKYLGGKGLGARYLYDRVGPNVGPLNPANQLIILVGPLSGYLPGDGRFAAITKSPLTGLFLDSYAGGSYARSFRSSMPEYAGIIITGSARELHILDCRGADPTLRPAAELAGAHVDTVDDQFGAASVLTVGPAGESGVSFATIAVDGGDHHAGRGGAGAVMGTKGLKAIVLPRRDRLEAPNRAIADLREQAETELTDSAYGAAYRTSGTLETVEFADATGLLSSVGWRDRGFSATSDIGIEAVRRAAKGREREKTAFPGDYRVKSELGETVIRGGTPIALGANLGVTEFDVVATLGTLCDRLGLDVISAGNTIALAMLASREGIIDRSLSFGDEDDARNLLEEIANRSSSLGETLSMGVERAAAELKMNEAIPTVKSMEVPSFDPRGAPAIALAYATSDRGACHRRAVPATVQVFESAWTPTQTAQATIAEQDRRAGLWCLIVDDLTSPVVSDLGREWLAAIGMEYATRELWAIGRRTWTLTRLFNVREGIDRQDDRLPAVFAAQDGIDRGWFKRSLSRYYQLRDWDDRGLPSRRLLERLGLFEIVDEHTPIGDHPIHGS